MTTYTLAEIRHGTGFPSSATFVAAAVAAELRTRLIECVEWWHADPFNSSVADPDWLSHANAILAELERERHKR